MSDLISRIYPAALDCGLSIGNFWDMSVLEITDYIESRRRRERDQLRQELMAKHFLARDISQHVSLILAGSEKVELKELWDFFPELFEPEKELCGRQMQDRQMAVYKAQMADFAYRHNRRKGGEA